MMAFRKKDFQSQLELKVLVLHLDKQYFHFFTPLTVLHYDKHSFSKNILTFKCKIKLSSSNHSPMKVNNKTQLFSILRLTAFERKSYKLK